MNYHNLRFSRKDRLQLNFHNHLMTLARFIFLVPIKNTEYFGFRYVVSGGVYQQLGWLSYSLSFSWNESVGIPDNERLSDLMFQCLSMF